MVAALAPGAAAQDLCALPNQLPPAEAIGPPVTQNAGGRQTAIDDLPRETNPPRNDRVTEICANREAAPRTIAVQPGTVIAATVGFTSAVMGRLDAVRGQMVAVGAPISTTSPRTDGLTDGLMGLGAGAKSHTPSPGPRSPFAVYATGSFLGGSRADAPGLSGFDYDATSGTVGLEYSVSRYLIVGLAGNYMATNADVQGGATADVSSVQAAAYLSYATRQWFVDALAAYGGHDLDLARPGVADPVRASTNADAFALAARGGYLFDFGRLRAGPITGLTYTRSRIDGYTETGDPNLTYTVSGVTLDSFIGSVGIRFLAPFRADGSIFIPYLNVTLEHQFGDGTQVLTATLAQAPSPIVSPFPAFDARNFGKVEGGMTVEFAPGLSASLSGASTFARDEGNDFRFSTGLNYRF